VEEWGILILFPFPRILLGGLQTYIEKKQEIDYRKTLRHTYKKTIYLLTLSNNKNFLLFFPTAPTNYLINEKASLQLRGTIVLCDLQLLPTIPSFENI
jgi:hypothetical protein